MFRCSSWYIQHAVSQWQRRLYKHDTVSKRIVLRIEVDETVGMPERNVRFGRRVAGMYPVCGWTICTKPRICPVSAVPHREIQRVAKSRFLRSVLVRNVRSV